MLTRYAAYKDADDTQEGLALKARYEAFVALLGNTVDYSSSSVVGLSINKDKKGLLDLTGASIISCNLIETTFDDVVLDDTVSTELEKAYVDSLGLHSTLATALKGYAGKAYKISASNDVTAGNSGVTAAIASLDTEWTSSTMKEGTTDGKLDFSSYSMFKAYVDAVAENVVSSDTTQGNVYVHVATAANASKWTITGIEGSNTHAIDSASTWSTTDTDAVKNAVAGAKAELKGLVGKKVYITFKANPTSSAAEIEAVSLTEVKASDLANTKYLLVLDLTNDNANTNWAAICDAVATGTTGALESGKTSYIVGKSVTVSGATQGEVA